MKASAPNEFNDIFEFCPNSDPQSLVKQVMSNPSNVQHFYEIEVRNGYVGSFDDFKNEDCEQRLIAHLPYANLETKDLEARNEASKYIRVISLSRCSLEPLLWAHYADSHKGCAIGIDVWNKSFDRARVNERVVYSSLRPTFVWGCTGPLLWEQLKKITVTKSKNWIYEREYRLAFPVEELEQRGGYCFVELNPQAVRRVVYGEQIDLEIRQRIESVLRHPEFSHVMHYDVKRDPRSYSLRLIRGNP